MTKCKQEEFNNCGPDLKGEFCLFHKPDKNHEESLRFYEELKKNHKDGEVRGGGEKWAPATPDEVMLNWTGYVFPTLPGSGSWCYSFQNSIFESSVMLAESVFEGVADFREAMFQDLFLPGAKFRESAKFERITVQNESVFENTIFFDDVSFVGAEFELAMFDTAGFGLEANFQDTTFEEAALFINSVFMWDARFEASTFNTPAYFEESLFKGRLSFGNADFRKGVAMETESEDLEEKYGTYQAEKESCRVQRIFYDDLGNKDKADRMFAREMRSQRKQYQESGGVKATVRGTAEYIIADWTCEYGSNWIRVLISSITLMVLFSLVYWIGDTITVPEIGRIESTNNNPPIGQPWVYFYYSIATFTTIGAGNISPFGPIMTALTALEASIGALFLALIIVVFSRKWMR